VGTPVVSPATIPSGQPTEITVMSRISDDATNPLIPASVYLLRVDANLRPTINMGTMRDDGMEGDAVAGDSIFTLRLTVTEPSSGVMRTVTEPSSGVMRLQVSAAFRGLMRRVRSNVATVEVRLPDSDPCAQTTAPCKSLSIGTVVIFSTRHDGIVTTAVRYTLGARSSFDWIPADFDWIPAGGRVTLMVKFQGGSSRPYQEFVGELPALEQANVLAGVMLGLNSSPLAGNHAGCDFIGNFPWIGSCSDRGECCDRHDVCIHKACTGPHDSGFLPVCVWKDYVLKDCLERHDLEYCVAVYPPCSPACRQCHVDALKCYFTDPGPGQSYCCKDEGPNDPSVCGKLQECIPESGVYKDKVLTDACLCEQLTGKSVSGCGKGNQGGASGDVHLLTFDRLFYDFQAVGEFVLVQSVDDNLAIQVRTKPWGNSRVVSVTSAVAMNVVGDRVAVYAGQVSVVYVNGNPWTSQGKNGLPRGGLINRTGNLVSIEWPDGSIVNAYLQGSYLDVSVLLAASRGVRVRGLLGDADTKSENDLVTRGGIRLSGPPRFNELYQQYGESWRVSQSESLFDYGNGETTLTYTDRTFPSGVVTVANLADAIRGQAEQVCRNRGVVDPILFEACVLDVGLTGETSFADFPATAPLPRAVARVDVWSATWDVSREYSRTSNPNGVWAYGRKLAVEGDAFDLMTVPWGSSGWYLGNIGHGGPSIQGGPQLWAKDNSNGFPVVRWTSPKSDVYDIQGVFVGADSRGVSNFAYVVVNGVKVAEGRVSGYLGTFPFSHTAYIEQGKHVDFVVVWNSQASVSSEYGWTQLSGFVSRAPNRDGLLGRTKENPAMSCLAIRQFGVVDGNRKYWVKLPSGIFEMYCNFSADTGGWTRVGALDTSTGYCGNNALADLRINPDASTGKIPDSDVQALMTRTPGSPRDLMYFSRSDGRYVWHTLERVTDFDTSIKHTSSSFYCNNWHCDDGTIDASACGSEGEGCPVTAHGISGFTKKIYVDSNFSRHILGMHVNGNMCKLPNYERASIWIYVR
jgi:hypothetical protein